MMESLTRGQLAKKTGIGTEALRFYERKGLIPDPPRSESGYRLYPALVLGRLRFIKRAKNLGFSLEEISDLLQLRVDPSTTSAQVREKAEAKLEEVVSKMRDLEKIRNALEKLTAACRGAEPSGDCPILEALESEAQDWLER